MFPVPFSHYFSRYSQSAASSLLNVNLHYFCLDWREFCLDSREFSLNRKSFPWTARVFLGLARVFLELARVFLGFARVFLGWLMRLQSVNTLYYYYYKKWSYLLWKSILLKNSTTNGTAQMANESTVCKYLAPNILSSIYYYKKWSYFLWKSIFLKKFNHQWNSIMYFLL